MPLSRLETCCSSIEYHATVAAGAAPGDAALLVLHPWSTLGGSMHDPTVQTICHAAAQSGAFAAVARYNGRGAGRTRASRAGGCRCADPEAEDAIAMAAHLVALTGASRVYLVGYSHGSVVAARALPRLPRAAGFVAVAPPLGVLSSLLLGARAAWAGLAGCGVPMLAVSGDADTFTSLGTLRAHIDAHNAAAAAAATEAAAPAESAPAEAAAAAAGAGACELAVIDGADHFFAERWDEVAAAVLAWALTQEERQSQPPAPPQ